MTLSRDGRPGGGPGGCDGANDGWRQASLAQTSKGRCGLFRLWDFTIDQNMQSRVQEVKYDLQILADRIEFCWIHLRGIGALENSLWGYDGQAIRVWLNALSIELPAATEDAIESAFVKESVNIPLDFYPMCTLSSSRSLGAAYAANCVSCPHGQRHHHRRRKRNSDADEPAICYVPSCNKRTYIAFRTLPGSL